MSVLKGLEPASVFRFFEEICGIPHGSGDTKRISDYCVQFAKERGLEVRQDEFNNVIIRGKGTPGYENAAPVMLQGHIDMVCEKEADCDIDFSKEGLRLRLEIENCFTGEVTKLRFKSSCLAGDTAILPLPTEQCGQLLCRITRMDCRDILGLFSIPMFAIGFLLPKIEGGYPWCLDISFVATGFILLGIALRQRLLIFAQQKGWVLCLFTTVSAAVLACGTFLRGDALELCLMCGSNYGNIFWFMLNAVSGSALVIGVSMLLFRISRESARHFSTAAITYVGQHTLGIFLLHKNFQLDLVIPWIHTWLEGPQLLVACIATLLSFLFSLLLCAVIEKFVPQLLGQFPRYPVEDSKQRG